MSLSWPGTGGQKNGRWSWVMGRGTVPSQVHNLLPQWCCKYPKLSPRPQILTTAPLRRLSDYCHKPRGAVLGNRAELPVPGWCSALPPPPTPTLPAPDWPPHLLFSTCTLSTPALDEAPLASLQNTCLGVGTAFNFPRMGRLQASADPPEGQQDSER